MDADSAGLTESAWAASKAGPRAALSDRNWAGWWAVKRALWWGNESAEQKVETTVDTLDPPLAGRWVDATGQLLVDAKAY
jgi:hypothetical protein